MTAKTDDKTFVCDESLQGCGETFKLGQNAKVPTEVFLPAFLVEVLDKVKEDFPEELKAVSFWTSEEGFLRGKYERMYWLDQCKPCFNRKNGIA